MTAIFPPPFIEHHRGHGRIETRTIRTSTKLNGYIEFPYAAQVFRIDRRRTDLKGNLLSEQSVYGVTSLTPDRADSSRILSLSREHWQIENRLHWVRDVTFDEDRSQIRTREGPRVFASLRNLVISLLRLQGWSNIAAGLRKFSRINPAYALKLIGC